MRFLYAICPLVLLCAACRPAAVMQLTAEALPAIAPQTDYGKGVSAAAAGEIDGVLLIAGGANFPGIPAAEGGSKRFYDDIFILPEGAREWSRAGLLPEASAYGAVFQLGDRIVVAGGANESGSLSGVVELTMVESHCGDECCDGLDGIFVVVSSMPPLPVAIEQAAAAHDGRMLYIAGGLSGGVPSTGVYRCDMESPSRVWEKIAELPEPMVQPVAALFGGRLWVWGGFDPVRKEACDYGYSYCGGQWRRVAGLPDGGTAVGSAAVQDAEGRLWIAGGVNREIFNGALNLDAGSVAEYQSQPVEWYRFRRQMIFFDCESESWHTAGESAAAARAGAAVVLSRRHGAVILNGELKPGIRSAEVNALQIAELNGTMMRSIR